MAAENTPPTFSDAELKFFLSTRRTVVVSATLPASRAIRKMMMQLGANAEKTITFDNFADAEKDIAATPTHILISDFIYPNNIGLELIDSQEKQFQNRLDVASVMVCADPNDSSIGMIAEANVDGILITPYNYNSFRVVMLQALSNKVKPSNYWLELEKAKAHFFKKEFDLAIPILEAAKKLDPKPILAFYYMGLIQYEKAEFDLAIRSCEAGLAFDEKNFRCLSAIFDIRMKTLEYEAAYEIAARIHKDHPVSMNRIFDLVKLSVYNKKFTDILDYYQIFKQIKKRDPFLNRVVIASMLVCAKYFALKSEKEKNLQVLIDAGKIATETETMRAEVFRYFIESGHLDSAETYHQEFPEAYRGQPEIRLLYLGLANSFGQDTNVIQLGGVMLKEGVKLPRVYKLMLDSSHKLNRSADKIAELVNEAKMLFPDEF